MAEEGVAWRIGRFSVLLGCNIIGRRIPGLELALSDCLEGSTPLLPLAATTTNSEASGSGCFKFAGATLRGIQRFFQDIVVPSERREVIW